MVGTLEDGPDGFSGQHSAIGYPDRATPDPVVAYERYHIETEEAPHRSDVPPRFQVDVGKLGLAKLLLKELVEYRDLEVVTSRPCMYGVFSGPLGGFAPREEHCVGCMRCTTQYPDFVEVSPHPDRDRLGDSFLTPDRVETILDEAKTGQVPVKGQGYRGGFGGTGWDGMWTDMSEIVRPTRDGIHGREFISTAVDLGSRPTHLLIDDDGQVTGPRPHVTTVQLPMLLDTPPRAALTGDGADALSRAYVHAAAEVRSLALLPVPVILDRDLAGPHTVPLVDETTVDMLDEMDEAPRLVEVDTGAYELIPTVRAGVPEAVIAARVPMGAQALDRIADLRDAGADVLHLTCDYHGRSPGDRFIQSEVRLVHDHLVQEGQRDRVSLIGSGGIVAAEHVPKALLSGLDAVALDTVPLVAVQATFDGEIRDREDAEVGLPTLLEAPWATQRLVNLLASWRDQLLEVSGAMGLREVRRMRGEMGRAMYQYDLEQIAFGDIDGFPNPPSEDRQGGGHDA